MLLMHGGADRQVNPAHTLQLGLKLNELGREFSLHIFEGDDHTISNKRLQRDGMAIDWFRGHGCR